VTSDPVAAELYFFCLGVLGLMIGSFLNVVIYRVPEGLSVIRPGSACPSCGTHISARDNIPVLSWLLLKGRCRACHAAISWHYPVIEAATGVLWLILGWWAWRPAGIDPLLPLLLILCSAGIALASIDVAHHRLPDAIVLPLYPVTVVGLAFAGLLSGDWPWQGAAVGAACWLGLLGGLWLFSGGRAMGFGDVKLGPLLGAVLGWVAVSCALVGLLAAFLTGAILGIVLLARGRAQRGSQVPFGPFLLLGAAIGLAVGEQVGAAYLASLGLT
jgi:leader peptidase (prepilin peptidase)/N-methyltransferase